MAYKIKGKNGLPIKKDGKFLLGYDIPATKIEQLNEKDLSFLAVGSTEDEDRDKDVIRVEGWQLKNFKNNPVLPWSHNYWSPPVGKAVSIKKDKEKKKLIFKAQFDADDDNARMIFNKYKNGFLNTFSVGFMPIEFMWRDEENRWYGGREYTKQELLEISPVTVPCNPNANMDIRGINDDLPPSLVQEGYKQFVCKLDSGLFVPVSDTEVYTQSSIISLVKNIKGVYGKPIDDPEKEKELVGYIFSDEMEEKEAQEWIKENSDVKPKTKYFDMGEKNIGDEDFELDVIEEEIKSEIVEEEEEETPKEKNIENEENTEENIDESEEKNTEEEEEKEIGEEKTKEIDLDEIAEKIFEKVKNLLIESKILVEKDEEIDNTDNVDSEEELKEKTEKSNDDGIVEFDSSLFSPVKEEKNDDFFELDETVLDEVKTQMKNGNEKFKELLETAIKDVFDGFSGKLED